MSDARQRTRRIMLLLLWAGILIVVLLCLWPPHVGTGRGGTNWYRAGRHGLWTPPWFKRVTLPSDEKEMHSYYWLTEFRVDTVRLFLECFVVALLTSGAMVTVRLKGLNEKERT